MPTLTQALFFSISYTPYGDAFPSKGGKVAVFATARKLAQLVYRMLRYGQDYLDEGQEAYEARFQHKRLAGIQMAADQMGYVLVPKSKVG